MLPDRQAACSHLLPNMGAIICRPVLRDWLHSRRLPVLAASPGCMLASGGICLGSQRSTPVQFSSNKQRASSLVVKSKTTKLSLLRAVVDSGLPGLTAGCLRVPQARKRTPQSDHAAKPAPVLLPCLGAIFSCATPRLVLRALPACVFQTVEKNVV